MEKSVLGTLACFDKKNTKKISTLISAIIYFYFIHKLHNFYEFIIYLIAKLRIFLAIEHRVKSIQLEILIPFQMIQSSIIVVFALKGFRGNFSKNISKNPLITNTLYAMVL